VQFDSSCFDCVILLTSHDTHLLEHHPGFPMRIISVCSLILASLFVSPIGFSQTTWTGAGTDDLWFNNDNWDMTAPNGVTVDVIVGAPSPTIINGNVNINSLVVTADGIIFLNSGLNLDFGGTATTTLTNAGIINTAFNTDLQLQQTVNNSGTINAGDDLEVDGGAMLMGGGLITMTADVNVNGTGTLTNVDNTIQGLGNIGNNSLGIANQAGGLIDANDNGGTMIIDPSSALGLTNTGTMQASNGGTLELSGFGSGSFNNVGGLIQALDGSTVVLTNFASVTGGTISTTGTGQVIVGASENGFFTDITNTGNLIGENNSDLGLSGSIVNSGTISVTSTGNATDIELQGGVVALSGGGTVTLNSTAGAQDARINGTGTLTNVDNTIEGSGNIGLNALGVANQVGGTIDANVNGELLIIDPSSALGLTNAGMMQASNGGVLVLSGFGNGTFDNTGGTIQALDGSQVQLVTSASVSNGTLSSSGSGFVTVTSGNSAFLSNLANTGTIITENNTLLGIIGTIDNSGTITIVSTGNTTSLNLNAGNTTLTGGGTVFLSSPGASTSAVINGTGTLSIVNQTIEGNGSIGSNAIGIDNQVLGLINANVSGEILNVDPSAANGLTNTGVMQASNGGILRLDGFGAGTFNNAGGLIQALDGSEVQMASSVLVTGGTFSTTGTGTFRVLQSEIASLVDVTNTGMLATDNNSNLRLSGTINNSGSISINSTVNATDITLFNGDVTIDGGGTITLNSPTGTTNARILGTGTLIVANQTIEGNGNLGSNGIGIDNQASGLIDANVSGEVLNVDPSSAGGLTNTGVMQASNGGILRLDGFGAGTFDNTGGLIQALTGSEVRMDNSAFVTGGTLSTTGSGQFTVVGGSIVFLSDLAITGNMATENNVDLRVGGTINNSGTVSVNSSGNATDIELQAGATLTGGGTIILNSTAGQVNARINGTGALINMNQTIQGFGSIGVNAIEINNQAGGIINASVNGETILIDPSGNLITNTGMFQASNGGTLSIVDIGTWTNDGTLNAGTGSEIVFQGNDPVLNSMTSTLMGNGTISAQNFEISGVVAPGASAGILTLEERTTVANSGVLLMDDAILQIQIGGTTLGSEYDQLNIEGTLGIMNSELQVSLINGYVPGQSDIFTIVNVNTIGAEDTFFGTFSNGSLVSFPGGTFDITYTSNSVILSNFQRVIPEPGTFSVVALLGLLAVGRRRRRI
jgi:hypothetical protein